MSAAKRFLSSLFYVISAFLLWSWFIGLVYDDLIIAAKQAGDAADLKRLVTTRDQSLLGGVIFIFGSAIVHRFFAPTDLKFSEIIVAGLMTAVFTGGMAVTGGLISHVAGYSELADKVATVSAAVGWWMGYGFFVEWFRKIKSHF